MKLIIPHTTWRGTYDAGTTATNGAAETDIAWVGNEQGVFYDVAAGRNVGSVGWAGSLIQGKRDASGLLYMRNRYYDPNSGRFTQQDPIGIAGGLNLYGFAGGDPVNFSDPFGLCPQNLGLLSGFLCNAIEATTTLIGSVGGFVAGGGAGAIAAAPTGELAGPITIPAGAVAGLAAGGVSGKLAGQAITSALFNESSGGASSGSGKTGGLEKQLQAHQKKLQDYLANPDASDNLGFLKDASPELRQKIIDARVRNLESQIRGFEEQIRAIKSGGGG